MYAEISPDSLIKALEPVTTLVDEAKLHVTDDGIYTKAVDPANVGMVEMNISSDEFGTLKIPDDKDELLLGVNLKRFTRQVQDINDEPVDTDDVEQTLHIELNESTRRITMWATPGSMEFTLSPLDPDSIRQEPDIPDMELPGRVELKSTYFTHAVKTAENYGDHITVGMDGEEDIFKMQAEGDTDDWEARLNRDHSSVDALETATVTSMFSLDYFKDIRKGLQDDIVVAMELGQEFPIRMMFDFLDSNVSVTYMIAPRIEDKS